MLQLFVDFPPDFQGDVNLRQVVQYSGRVLVPQN